MSTPRNLAVLRQAEVMAQEGRFAEALALCDEVLARDFEDAAALTLKGRCLADQGRFEDALPFFRLARRHLPHYAPICFNLAKALDDSGRADEALAEYGECLKLDDQHFEARAMRGGLLLARRDEAGAVREFEELTRRNPGVARAHMLLGACCLVFLRRERACAELGRALALDPSLQPHLDRLLDGMEGKEPA